MHNVIDVYNQTTLGTVSYEDTSRAELHDDIGLLIPQRFTSAEGQETCWPDFCEVQREIAKTVLEHYAEGDLIWIHVRPHTARYGHVTSVHLSTAACSHGVCLCALSQNYHMMLLPMYLARKIHKPNVGKWRVDERAWRAVVCVRER